MRYRNVRLALPCMSLKRVYCNPARLIGNKSHVLQKSLKNGRFDKLIDLRTLEHNLLTCYYCLLRGCNTEDVAYNIGLIVKLFFAFLGNLLLLARWAGDRKRDYEQEVPSYIPEVEQSAIGMMAIGSLPIAWDLKT